MSEEKSLAPLTEGAGLKTLIMVEEVDVKSLPAAHRVTPPPPRADIDLFFTPSHSSFIYRFYILYFLPAYLLSM